MASWNPNLADSDEPARRVARIQKRCDALEDARHAAARPRGVIGMKNPDAEDMAFISDKPNTK